MVGTARRAVLEQVGTARRAVPGGKAAGILPVGTVRPLRPSPAVKPPENVAPAWGADGAARHPYHPPKRAASLVGTARRAVPGGKAAGILLGRDSALRSSPAVKPPEILRPLGAQTAQRAIPTIRRSEPHRW